MQTKKQSGSETPDLDEAPQLDDAFFASAELFEGDKFLRHGRGRPKIAHPKEPVNLRIDQDVLSALRNSGPGWQTKINSILRTALNLD